MADKCIIHCTDHLCIHNSCSGYHGVCALSAMSVSARYGISRSYVNTCAKKVPIPNCIARGPGKIAVFAHGRAGNGKSSQDLEKTVLQILKTDPHQRIAYSSDFGIETEKVISESSEEPKTFTADELVASIRYAIQQFEEVHKTESTPWLPPSVEFERKLLGIWHYEEEENE